MSGLSWVEISYLGYFSPECLQLGRNSFLVSKTSDLIKSKCVGTFVFIGDVISMAHSVRFGAYLPNVLERILMCTFHVSLTLALLNSLPVSSYTNLIFSSFACLCTTVILSIEYLYSREQELIMLGCKS
jgi:hypothetical protein